MIKPTLVLRCVHVPAPRSDRLSGSDALDMNAGQSGHSIHGRHVLPDAEHLLQVSDIPSAVTVRSHTPHSTGGSPPFTPDSNTPTNTNEPYLDWLNFILAQTSLPQTFT